MSPKNHPSTLPSVLEEGYLIEEGGLAKFQNVTRGGSFSYKRGSDRPKTLQEGVLIEEGGLTHFTVLE